VRKLRGQRVAVGLAGSATEVFYVVCFHVPSLLESRRQPRMRPSTGPLLVW
jgi:hypothetical protein